MNNNDLPADLARIVNDAIESRGANLPRFSNTRVYIAPLLEQAADSLHENRETLEGALVEANRRHLLTLGRADHLVAMDPELVQASHIHDRGSDFHFVVDETGREYATPVGRPEPTRPAETHDMSTTHAAAIEVRQNDRAIATDLSWIDELSLDQQGDELLIEMDRVVAVDPRTAYGQAVKDLRLDAINERFEVIAAQRAAVTVESHAKHTVSTGDASLHVADATAAVTAPMAETVSDGHTLPVELADVDEVRRSAHPAPAASSTTGATNRMLSSPQRSPAAGPAPVEPHAEL